MAFDSDDERKAAFRRMKGPGTTRGPKNRVSITKVPDPKPDVDLVAANELELFMENDEPLYRQMNDARRTLLLKLRKGIYDHERAPALWRRVVDAAATSYVRQFGGTVREVFPTSVRAYLAQRLADEEIKDLRGGQHDWLLEEKHGDK